MKAFILTIIAAFGGGLGYVYRETAAGRKISFFNVCLSAFLVAFVCFHLGIIYYELGFNERVIWALNGFTSVLGVEFIMSMLKKIIFRQLGITQDDVINEKLIHNGWLPPPGVTGIDSDLASKNGAN